MQDDKKTEMIGLRLTRDAKIKLETMADCEDRTTPSFLDLIIRTLAENYILLRRIQSHETERTGYQITFFQIISTAINNFAQTHQVNSDLDIERIKRSPITQYYPPVRSMRKLGSSHKKKKE